ncbi:PHD/FYVE-zinc-finger like domain-containing protein [Hypoxylon sp. FL1284]|nr:PHD/FYVE-zinc-finger like domain-containing protein [Hypoxylon sp. FL1284]
MSEPPPGAVPPAHRPIEVVLAPPQNPAEYVPIPRSNVVHDILDKVEEVNGTFYYVEFTSSHVDQLSANQLLQLENGPAALRNFRTRRLNMTKMEVDEASSSGETDYNPDEPKGPTRRRRARAVASEASDPSERSKTPKRASSREAPRREASRRATESIRNSFEDPANNVDKVAVAGASSNHSLIRQAHNDSEDELAQDSESDRYADEEVEDSNASNDGDFMLPNIRSDINDATTAPSRKRKRSKKSGRSTLQPGSDSDVVLEPSRRSQRIKTTKNMREPDVDVEDEPVQRAIPAPKHRGAKETFEELPGDCEFGRWHSQECTSCGCGADSSKGPLIFCQGCSYSYHQACLGPRSQREHRATKVGPEFFVLQCKFCVGSYLERDPLATTHSACQVCKEAGPSCKQFSEKLSALQEETIRLSNGGEDPITDVEPALINNAWNVLFRCSTCSRAYHFSHLPPISLYPDGFDVREQHLEDYSRDDVDWNCKDCSRANEGIHGLVAWRPVSQEAWDGDDVAGQSEDNKEYLVKWQNRSHFHDTWMPGAWVYGVAPAAMRKAFHNKEENIFPKPDTESAVPREWLLADLFLDVRHHGTFIPASKEHGLAGIANVFEVRVKFQGLGYDEVVWDQPPPSDSGAPWEAFRDAYAEYLTGRFFPSSQENGMRNRVRQYRAQEFKTECELQSQPGGLTRKLMEYQLEGVNWLLLNFHQQQNVILADEMGLGKTIQIVSFLTSLVEDQPQCWPFLVVVPNSTCPNWRREMKTWAPGLRVVAYHGGRVAQDLAYGWELFPNGVQAGMKAHVVIMSYEAAAAIKSEFRTVRWAGLVVDEGQRLKNDETQLYQKLRDMKFPFKVLLTGTPLQNNKRELFNLLQFVDERNVAAQMDERYKDLTKENLAELHNLIRPYFLRRTKVEVLKFLPPISQVIVPVTMTVLQEKLCKSIVARNPELIKAILSNGKMKASDRKGLVNIMADLRQCLCHPFCFSDSVEDRSVSYAQTQRNLIEASPKLMLMELMLPKLKQRGNRVLIFSQFLGCLDIIEDFLNILGLQYGRIDGQMTALKKQKQIDAFNAKDSPLFAMLLTTRAGGVGINLASADTVIIYDPDWNPHQDIQAISRAHRIGQKERVLCFQLTTKDTVEENILQAGKKKLALDQALIERLDSGNVANEDVETILKRGAEALFSDGEKAKIVYDEASIEKLLDRSRADAKENNDAASDTLFRVWSNDAGAITDGTANGSDDASLTTDPSVWDAILREREKKHREEAAVARVEYGRGARRRGKEKIDYSQATYISDVNDVDGSIQGSITLPHEESDSAGSSADVDYDVDRDNDNDDDDDEYNDPMDIDTEGQAPNIGAPTIEKSRTPKQTSVNYAQETTSNAKTNFIPNFIPNGTAKFDQSAAHPQTLLARNPHFSQIRPPQNTFQNRPSMNFPSSSNFPNFVDLIPGRGRNTNVDQRAASDFSLPVPKTVHSQRPKWTQITTPANEEGRKGVLGVGPTSPTTEGGICLICKGRHPSNHSCVDFGSEISLRLAIDSLRSRSGQTNVQAYRDLLVRQLRQLTGR